MKAAEVTQRFCLASVGASSAKEERFVSTTRAATSGKRQSMMRSPRASFQAAALRYYADLAKRNPPTCSEGNHQDTKNTKRRRAIYCFLRARCAFEVIRSSCFRLTCLAKRCFRFPG